MINENSEAWEEWTSDEGDTWNDLIASEDTTWADLFGNSDIMEIDEFLVEAIPNEISAFDDTNAFIGRTIPSVIAAPTGSGLFMGSDYMGFYNGSEWRSYIDNSGNFYCGNGANEYVQMISGALSLSTAQTNAITIKSGGDISLEGDDIDPGILKFSGTSYSTYVGNYLGTGATFNIRPVTDETVECNIGTSTLIFKEVNIYGHTNTFLCREDADNESEIYMYPSASVQRIQFRLKSDATQGILEMYHTYTPSHVYRFAPTNDDEWYLGTGSERWKRVFAISFAPGDLSDSSAANNTIYYSTTQSKLVYKDSGGSVHDLY
jgi:hypothetical protein